MAPIKMNIDELAELVKVTVTDVKESLEREIQALHPRFDDQASRLDRQGALLRAGTRLTTRMSEWAERIDAALETKNHELAEVRKRLTKLEKKGGAR